MEPIDLLHLGNERVIGVYVVETPEGPALFDCGPASTFERLREAVDLDEIKHLLLSHIHLDHAGAAGRLLREYPHIRVHVSEAGAPHVVDPSRLIASARRLYGDDLDTLYREPLPVPQASVEVIWDTAAGVKAFASPGHAAHHVCYLMDDGTLLAGDAAGVRILPAGHVVPAAPPPRDRRRGLERDVRRDPPPPARAARAHPLRRRIRNGIRRGAHRSLRARLALWTQRVDEGMGQDEFVAAATADLEASEGEGADTYLRAAPFYQSYLGLERYTRKKGERDAEAAASA